jgi:hypothetical protein
MRRAASRTTRSGTRSARSASRTSAR